MNTMYKSKKSMSKLNPLYSMVFLTIITQAIMLTRLSVTASNFGATMEMDAFNFSNSIGSFIFSFISTGITTVLIPAMINKKKTESVNNFITILYAISIVIVMLVILFRKSIITIFHSTNKEFINIASNIIVITLVTQFLNTILGVTNAVFQCNEKYNLPKIINLFSTSILTIIVLLDNSLNIYQYALYILLIGLINVLLSVYFCKKEDFKYKIIINLKDEETKRMFTIFIPTVFSAGVYQVSLLTDSLISSTLGEGQISMLSYSNSIMSMINTLLVGNLMIYIYPRIAKKSNYENNKKYVFDCFIVFNSIISLFVVGFILVGKEAITILYQGGNFTSNITNVVFNCTLIYMIGLPINIMRDLLYRYFYSKGNTKSTLCNSISASMVNIVISIILSKYIGVYGIVIGTVITSIFSFTSILIRFYIQYKMDFEKKNIVVENLKVFISSVITIFIVYIFKKNFIIKNVIISILLYGIFTCIIYISSLFILKIDIKKDI